MKVRARTKIAGIIGYPLSHTLSPLMHNKAFSHLGIDYIYLPLEVREEDLKDAINGIKALNFVGVNVTVPYKEKVIPYLDELSKEAELIGAVNTIHNKGGRLIGYNTDATGFINSLKHAHINLKNRMVTIIGAGGAAKAVAFALCLKGIKKLFILNRTKGRAENLMRLLSKKFKLDIDILNLNKKNLDDILMDVDILINATSLGMYPYLSKSPIYNFKSIKKDLLVYDLVYNPPYTLFLRLAKMSGARIFSGLEMLILQGAESFEIWTGRKAPVEIMRRAVRDVLKLR